MAIIPIMWRIAPQLGLIDQPDPRKVHKSPIPRVGGWGIVTGTLLPIVITMRLDPLLQSYVLGSLILFAFGAWDDAKDIGHYKKFVGQLLAVTLLVFHGGVWIERIPFIGTTTLIPALGIPLTYFAMVGMINAVNHSDGLDGLAGGESLLSLLVIGFLAYSSDGGGMVGVLIAIAAIGGILGFLRYNTHPARVFMGDTGSQFLGFTLGFMAILLTQDINPALSPAIALFLLGLPVIDIVAVLFLRIRGGMNWFRATRNHIHHRLLDRGFRHSETVIIIYAIHATFMIAAILLRFQNDWLVSTLYLMAAAGIFSWLTVAERIGWRKSRMKEVRTITRIMESTLRRTLYLRYPYYAIAVLVPLYLFVFSSVTHAIPHDFTVISGILAAILLVEMALGRQPVTFLLRGAIYVAIVFTVFLSSYEGTVPAAEMVQGVYFTTMVLLAALTVRYSGDVGLLRTTPMDYLILIGVCTIAVLGQGDFEFNAISLVIVKAVILLYAAELVIERAKSRWSLLNVAALFALGCFAVRGFLAQ